MVRSSTGLPDSRCLGYGHQVSWVGGVTPLKITSMEKSKMFFAWASQDRNGSVDFSFLSSLKAFVTLRTVLGVDDVRSEMTEEQL